MIGVLRSELFKLRTTRATKVVVLSAVILPSVIMVLTAVFGFENNQDNQTLLAFTAGSIPLVGLLMGVVGVLCSTQEYSQGTIRITLVATPRRWKVLVAKVITVLITAVGATAALLVLSIVPSQIILNSRGIAFETVGADIRILLSMFILTVWLAELGLFLGLIFKSSPGAISALLLWPTIIEGLIFALLSLAFEGNILRFAPVQGNGFSLVIVGRAANDNSWLLSLGYFTGFVAVFVVLGSLLFSRRDA
jgi:ABC-type transport system involved in multi-copper enzyme maturation permease subunit